MSEIARRAAADAVLAGFKAWAAKPHNAKWVKRIDGTPIPNDLPVCIQTAIMELPAAPAAQVCPTEADASALDKKYSETQRALSADALRQLLNALEREMIFGADPDELEITLSYEAASEILSLLEGGEA